MGHSYIGETPNLKAVVMERNAAGVLEKVDLTGYQTIKVRIKKPDNLGTIVERVPTSITEVDGIVQYQTILDDFTDIGEYLIQIYVDFGSSIYNKAYTFRHEVLNDFD